MYKFTNFPKSIKQSEYINQENKLIEFLKTLWWVVSVYSIWELWLYGVSDLDYLIIFDKNIDTQKIIKFSEKFQLIDTILFLDISKLEQKNYLSHHFNYKFVYWKNLDLEFDTKNKNLNIIYAWKVCYVSLLRNFYYYKYNNEINVKHLLSQINDIRYPMFFLKNLWIEKIEYEDFINNFSIYRSNYFEHKDYKKLEEFLKEAIILSWDIIWELSKQIKKGNTISFSYGRFPTCFQNLKSLENHQKLTEKKLKKIWKISRFLYLPPNFDFKNWDENLKNDLSIIVKNNNKFTNFWLNSKLLNMILFFKKILDFIILRILWRKN